jgi:hypothetical protein
VSDLVSKMCSTTQNSPNRKSDPAARPRPVLTLISEEIRASSRPHTEFNLIARVIAFRRKEALLFQWL